MKVLSKKEMEQIFKEEKPIGLSKDMLNRSYSPRVPVSAIPGSQLRTLGKRAEFSTQSKMKKYLLKVFKEDKVFVYRDKKQFLVMGFELEDQKFFVWFNTSGNGTAIETNCTSPKLYHEFCLSLMRRLKLSLDETLIPYLPTAIRKQVKRNKQLPKTYLNEFVLTKASV